MRHSLGSLLSQHVRRGAPRHAAEMQLGMTQLSQKCKSTQRRSRAGNLTQDRSGLVPRSLCGSLDGHSIVRSSEAYVSTCRELLILLTAVAFVSENGRGC